MTYPTNKVIKIFHAIESLNADANFKYTEEDIDTIEWLDGTSEISKSDIKTKVEELQKQYDNNKYQRDRAVAYPSLQEFAEAYCEKEIGGDSTKWDAYKTAYNKVRTDNPKE